MTRVMRCFRFMRTGWAIPVVFLTVLLFSSVVLAEEAGYLVGTADNENGKPLGGGYIYLFNASQAYHGPIRGRPAYLLGPIGADGSFEFRVPAGSYYYTVIRRQDGALHYGQPEDGDSVFFEHKTPLVIESGARVQISIRTERFKDKLDKNSGFIKGFVRDEQGKPVEGVIIRAVPQVKAGNTRPGGFVIGGITSTNKDGSYKLKVSAGKFFLRAMSGPGPDKPILQEKAVEVRGGKTIENFDMTIRKDGKS